MDSGLIVQHMLSQQLLNDQEVHTMMSAASDYQKNCLVVEKIRLMDRKFLLSLCEMLQISDSQKHIAAVLFNGKILILFLVYLASYNSQIAM